MCPYRTYLGAKNQKENFPCEICSNEECSGLILGDLNVKLDPSMDCHPPQDNYAREAKQILVNDLIE